MSFSFLFENPGTALLTILAFVAGILLFPVVAAVRRSRNARDRESQRPREPRLRADLYSAYHGRRDGDRSRADDPPEHPSMRRDSGYVATPYEADDAYRRPDWDYAGYDVDDDGYPRRDAGYAGGDVEDLYAHEHSDRGYQARLAEADVDHRGYRSVSDDPPDDRRQKPSDRWEHREKDGEGTARPIFGPGSVTQMRKSARPLGAAKGLWFVFGAAVGIVVAMIWSSVPTVGSLTTLLASFDAPSPPAVADQSAAGDASKAQERMTAFDQTAAAAPSADQGDVGQLIDAFVVSLRNQLPMTVGPGITMAAVTAESNTIALGFTIAQAIAAEDEPKLQSELENRFRTSVCATEPNPTNIHGLNRRGVSFLITYTDILGRNVAGLTVGANYCSSPA